VCGDPSKMLHVLQVAVLALILASYVHGDCPNVDLIPKFDVKRYMGTWYEIQAQESSYRTVTACGKSEYSLLSDAVHVVTQGEDESGAPQKDSTKMSISENPARMFTSIRTFLMTLEPPFEVLDTDYESYSCVHSCLSFSLFGTYQYMWVYSRSRTLEQSKIDACRTLFSKYAGTDVISGLKNTPQVGC